MCEKSQIGVIKPIFQGIKFIPKNFYLKKVEKFIEDKNEIICSQYSNTASHMIAFVAMGLSRAYRQLTLTRPIRLPPHALEFFKDLEKIYR